MAASRVFSVQAKRRLLLVLLLSSSATLLHEATAEAQNAFLTSRPRPASRPPATLKIGMEISTGAGERERVALADGSIVFLNENSRLKLPEERRIELSRGEIFVELADNAEKTPWTVMTPQKEISTRGGHLGVLLGETGTRVVVTRGKARIAGMDNELTAGQFVGAGATTIGAAPRLSQLLAWTREPRTGSETPLVPANERAGGQIVVLDKEGKETKIELVKHHIDVHLEDGFARTTIDQTYFNHQPAQLEGTFYFPLPADTSLSRLAMYVNGVLMEGGMAERDLARQVYETIRYQRSDPALLEWVDGTTFKMRVFPLEPRQHKRIVLSYTQKLPVVHGEQQYRFPAGHDLGKTKEWSFHARIKNGSDVAWMCSSHELQAIKELGDLLLEGKQGKARLDRDVVLTLRDKRDGNARFSSSEQDGSRYLIMNYQPALMAPAKIERRDWIFLCETSGERDPLLVRTQVELIRHLLTQADVGDTFTVLAANTRVRAWSPEPVPITPENMKAALEFLENAHVIGALDLGQALGEAAQLCRSARSPWLVHLGSGIAAMGERRDDELAGRIPAGARYVGIGVGRRWSRSFMKSAAQRTGGHFTQINPDEPIAWRAFDLLACLNAPRLLDVQVNDAASHRYLVTQTAIAQGEEVCALTRLGPDETLPKTITVRGVVDGKPFEKIVPVHQVRRGADYLPRTWAKLEIDRLLADDPVKHRKTIVDLSKAMYVMTPLTSLLVLENEDMYTQYKVDRGRKDHWAMYPCPEKMPVDGADEAKTARKPTVEKVLETLVHRGGESDDEKEALKQYERTLQLHQRRAISAQEKSIALQTYLRLRRQHENPWREIRSSVRHSEAFLTAEDFAPAPPSFPVPVPSSTSLHSDLPIAMKNSSFDFSGAVYGGYPGRLRGHELARDLYGWRGWSPSEKQSPIYIVGNEVTQDRVIRRFMGTAQALRYPGQRIAEANLALANLFDAEPRIQQLLNQSEDVPLNRGKKRMQDSEPPASKPESDDSSFYDLVAYAPGLHTSSADVEAVLEAEALADPASKPGHIDDGVRELLGKARFAGWRSWTIDDVTIQFDAAGRFAYERVLPPGIAEKVLCDGQTLLHVYPQLGLGARRTVSRFHRDALSDALPCYLPPADDLAHGADLKLIADRTVAIIPHLSNEQQKEASSLQLHLVFAPEGRLVESRLVRMPENENILRQILDEAGAVKVLDGKGRELSARSGKFAASGAPAFDLATKDLVILPLPHRTPEHVRKTLKLDKKSHQELTFKEALPLLAAEFARGNGGEVNNIFRAALHAREQRQLGFYVLLAACGQNLDSQNGDVLAEHLDNPVAQYLALYSSPVLRKHASQWAVSSEQWKVGFLQHLGLTHALLQRWQNDKLLKGDPVRAQLEIRRALDYIHRHKGTRFAWALLCLVQDRAADSKDLHAKLAECFGLFADVAGIRYAARYERARSLLHAGKVEEARGEFVKLYEEVVQQGSLPALDQDFRRALGPDVWNTFMRQTATELVRRKQRPALLALARQTWRLEDPPLTQALLDLSLEGITDEAEQAALSLAQIEFHKEIHQPAQADQLVRKLLAHPAQARRAELWRLASELAEQRDMPARAVECLEKAFDLEAAKPSEVIDLEALRRDYGKVLDHYQRLADAMVALKQAPPDDFRARVVRAADRWRLQDADGSAACRTAAAILHRLGDRDLAWDYRTTPIAHQPAESGPWLELATTLARLGDAPLADRAYRAAFEAEPTNAQLLWDRAMHLRQSGQYALSQKLMRQIADSDWQPRFQGVRAQARMQLK